MLRVSIGVLLLFVFISKACLTHEDCDDGKPYTTDWCVFGECEYQTSDGFCQSDCECYDQNSCTIDICDISNHTCRYEYIPNCCIDDGDCNSVDPCLTGSCSSMTHRCDLTWNVDGCCQNDADCFSDDDCMNDRVYCNQSGSCLDEIVGNPPICRNHTICGWPPLPGILGLCSGPDPPTNCSFCHWRPNLLNQCGVCKTRTPSPPPGDLHCCRYDTDCTSTGICNLPNTYVCDPDRGNCADIASAPPHLNRQCVYDSDCDDNDICTQDDCVYVDHFIGGNSNCQYTNIGGPNCCANDTDCDDHNCCTVDTCVLPLGVQCINLPVPSCECCSDGECEDGFPYTVDKCINNLCVNTFYECWCREDCGSAPNDTHVYECLDHNCTLVELSLLPTCALDNECDDGNPCTNDYCLEDCINDPIPDCCSSDCQCDDGDVCTRDMCIDNVCTNETIPGCCIGNSDCPFAGCLSGLCNLVSHQCEIVRSQSGCCVTDYDCYHGDVCDDDLVYCEVSTGTCYRKGLLNSYDCAGPLVNTDVCNTTDTCWACKWGPGREGLCGWITTTNNGGPNDACCNNDTHCQNCLATSSAFCFDDKTTCLFGPDPLTQCLSLRDCDDHDPLTTDSCQMTPTGLGTCVHNPIIPFCNTDDDCADYGCQRPMICNGSQCIPTGEVPECCIDDHCNQLNDVHKNYCFNFTCIEGCYCAEDCPAPQSACTINHCVNRTCQPTTIENCCYDDDECPQPPSCYNVECNIFTNRCEFIPIEGCIIDVECYRDWQCDDGHYCTADQCIDWNCTYIPVEDCCESECDCNPTNHSCIIPTCVNHECTFESVSPLCCDTDMDCGGNPCFSGTCDPVAHMCYTATGQTGCCTTELDCHMTMTGDFCSEDFVQCQQTGRCVISWLPTCTNHSMCGWTEPSCHSGNCDACLWYPGREGRCGECSFGIPSPLDACCYEDQHCFDCLNATEGYFCDLTYAQCLPRTNLTTCVKHSDCIDDDGCTNDQCYTLSSGESYCVHPGSASCCSSDFHCNDHNFCTNDWCNTTNGQCHNDGNPFCECSKDWHCDDNDPLTKDVCVGGYCVNYGECYCSEDCPSPTSPCLVNECVNRTCSTSSISICCEIDDDCAPAPVCYERVCRDNQCQLYALEDCPPLPDDGALECISDNDCDDGNSCTADQCILMTRICEHLLIPSPLCCVTDEQCDDFNDCTVDRCINNTCNVSTIPNCCENNADCTALGDPCLSGVCSDVTHLCVVAEDTPGCCSVDADCFNGDLCRDDWMCCQVDAKCHDLREGATPCTTHEVCDIYNSPTQCSLCVWHDRPLGVCGVCSNTTKFFLDPCCRTHEDCWTHHGNTGWFCDLSEGVCHTQPLNTTTCTTDLECQPTNNTCATTECNTNGQCTSYSPIEECCLDDYDCHDCNYCTLDDCLEGVGSPDHPCSNLRLANCECAADHMCDDHNDFTIDQCINNQCVNSPIDCLTVDDCGLEPLCHYWVCLNNTCVVYRNRSCCIDHDDCQPPPTGFISWCGLDHVCRYYPEYFPQPCVGECLVDGDCDDQKFWTTDFCVYCSCFHVLTPEMCEVRDTECDDSHFCTEDVCDLQTHQCSYYPTFPPLCCENDDECVDDDVCTSDVCIDHQCINDFVVGCCRDDGDCPPPIPNPCLSDMCNPVTHQCVPLLNVSSGCCEQDVDCFSGNECYDDRTCCIDGVCVDELSTSEVSCTTHGECPFSSGFSCGICKWLPHMHGQCGVCVETFTVKECCDDETECDPQNSNPYICDMDKGHCELLVGPAPEDVECFGTFDCDDLNSCTTDSCVLGMCVHTGDAYCCQVDDDCDDCDCCTEDICIGTCHNLRWPNCECCSDVECNDDDAATLDECINGHCDNRRVPGLCATAVDCGTPPSCHIYECLNGHCSASIEPHCCRSDSDCTRLDAPCIFGMCDENTQRCATSRHPSCCFSDEECDDADGCTIDECTYEGGCIYRFRPWCCNNTEDCVQFFNYTGQCIAIFCDDGECQQADIGSCCNDHADCNSGDDCTIDYCTQTVFDNICVHDLAPGCCFLDEHCDDNNECTNDQCLWRPILGHYLCEYTPIQGCCENDGDCLDDDRCTNNWCDTQSNTCQQSFVVDFPHCCLNNAHCDDSNLCTTDTCVSETCVNSPVICNDQDSCTHDYCNPSTGNCVYDNGFCDCDVDGDCDDQNDCSNDTCVAHRCVHTPVITPYPCCDNHTDCTDHDDQTTDICINNQCIHVPCCEECSIAADCPIPAPCIDVDCIDSKCVVWSRICELDGSVCTVDWCNPILDQCQTYQMDCDNSNWCTIDTCNSSTGCHHVDRDCDDLNPNTFDYCDSGLQECINAIVCSTNNDCDDSDLCTIDVCLAERCGYIPVVCNDNSICTDDRCDPLLGCVFELRYRGCGASFPYWIILVTIIVIVIFVCVIGWIARCIQKKLDKPPSPNGYTKDNLLWSAKKLRSKIKKR